MSETKWSDEQLQIFEWFSGGIGNLVVKARAGTGKTTTIKAAFEVAPEAEMLYAVFNKKNQVEASAKIVDPRVTVKTLHGVGFGYILQHWPGSKPDGFVERDRVSGNEDLPTEVVTAACKIVSFAKNQFNDVPDLQDLIEIAKSRGIDVSEELEECGFTAQKLASLAHRGLKASRAQDKKKRISFDDMVWLPVALGWARPRFDLVVVDEAQDMNLPQLTMAIKAVREGGRVCVVGDDRQAIYGFRGAVQNGINYMIEKLSAKVLPLTITYRCPKKIVELASSIVPDYRAAGAAPEGILRDVGVDTALTEVEAGDAILSRKNAPLMGLCLRLLRNGVPARIEGRDIGKMLAKIAEKLKARSVPDFLTKLGNWAERQKRRAAISGSQAQIASIEDQELTLRAVAEGAASVHEISKRLNELFQDSKDGDCFCVVLSTVHKAKGLEWDRVFVLEDTFRSNSDEGEEANIRYVAYTRAKQELVLTVGETPSER